MALRCDPRIPWSIRLAALVMATLLGGASPSAHGRQASDPWTGTFVNAEIRLVLAPAGDRYVGRATLEGQVYPVSARKTAADTIEGTYSDAGEEVAFRAVLKGDRLTVTTGDEVILLMREVEAAPEKPKAAAPAAGTSSGALGDRAWGIQFRPPTGWAGRKAGGLFVLGSDTHKGAILVMPHEATSLDELRAAAREGLAEGEGTRLKLVGQPVALGKEGLGAEFTGTLEGKPAKAYAIGLLSPHGTGAVILAVVEPGSYSKAYPEFARAIASSTRFSRPEAPPVIGEWKRDLSGWRLTYLWSYFSGGGSGAYVGGSQRTEIDLCPQGFFRYRDSSSLSADGGLGSGVNVSGTQQGKDQGQGQWEVLQRGTTPLLRLTFHDGRVQEYELAFRERKLYLNGKRFFRGERADCD